MCNFPVKGQLQCAVNETVPRTAQSQPFTLLRACCDLTQRGRGKQVVCGNIHVLINALEDKAMSQNNNTSVYKQSELYSLLPQKALAAHVKERERWILFHRTLWEILTYSSSRAQSNGWVYSSCGRRFPFKIVPNKYQLTRSLISSQHGPFNSFIMLGWWLSRSRYFSEVHKACSNTC